MPFARLLPKHSMPDRLYLTYTLATHAAAELAEHFATLVSEFPVSRLAKAESALRVFPLSFDQAPILERPFLSPVDEDVLRATVREYVTDDHAFEFETFWDLWQHDGKDWHVGPARVRLIGHGPEFEGIEPGEHLSIEFGLESQFLPDLSDRASLRTAQSNIRSLLHLVSQIDAALPVHKRRLWSESGENFAEKLESTLRAAEVQ